MVTDEAIEIAQCKIQSSVNLQHEYISPRESSEEVNASCDLDILLRSLDTSSAYEMNDMEVLQVHKTLIKNMIIILQYIITVIYFDVGISKI